MPPSANFRASAASFAGGRPCGLIAEQVSARFAGVHARAQAVEPVPRPAEHRRKLVRDRGVMQDNVVVDRGVAEQHVEELPGVAADRRRRQRDSRLEQSRGNFADAFDAPGDLRQHMLVVDRRERHLDALLDGDRLRARVDRFRVAADVIDRLQPGHDKP